MPLERLTNILQDARNEPQWRDLANKCADYYDHKQASADWIARVQQTGEPLTIINLIQRTINGALGQEAKTRLNWKVTPDSDYFKEISTVLGERLSEAQREGRSDLAISEAYSSMLRTGIGWVEVSQDPDPLAYFLRFNAVHRNDVYWDWRAKLADKSDARWMMRQRWVDLDEAKTLMPRHKELFEIGCNNGPITDAVASTLMLSRGTFDSIYDIRRRFTHATEEWLDDGVRKRVRFYSVYYKQFKREVAMVSGTKRVRYNAKNPIHQQLVQSGQVKLLEGPSHCIRHAMFAGPFRLFDVEMPTRRFPLVPFVCYSADDDYSPYGLIHGMIEPQDEYNKRRSRLLWLLQAKQIFVDDDALNPEHNDFAQLAQEAMRPDAMFVLNANRRNANGLVIKDSGSLSREQAEVMNDSKQLIQDQPGLFSPQFGSNGVGANSGVALNSLMEQSVASLGETSDNYRMSRQVVGDLALDFISNELKGQEIEVYVGSGAKRKAIVLNTWTPEGLPKNHIEDAQMKVGLGDIPTSPAYKAQEQQKIANILSTVGSDQAARAILLPALIESGDMEHRAEYAKWLRQQYGVPEPGQEDEQMQQGQQQAKQAQQQQNELAARAANAKIATDEAKAMKTQAEAAKVQQEVGMVNQPALQPTEQDLIQQALAEAEMA